MVNVKRRTFKKVKPAINNGSKPVNDNDVKPILSQEIMNRLPEGFKMPPRQPRADADVGSYDDLMDVLTSGGTVFEINITNGFSIPTQVDLVEKHLTITSSTPSVKEITTPIGGMPPGTSMFHLSGTSSLTIKDNITLSGPDVVVNHPLITVDSSSAGILLAGNAIIQNCKLSRATGTKTGSAINIDGGGALIMSDNATIKNCEGVYHASGGAVYIANGTFYMFNDTSITECRSDYFGGGVYLFEGNMEMYNNASINDCHVAPQGNGGGIYVMGGGSFSMHGYSNINNCTSEYHGGGVSYRGLASPMMMNDNSSIFDCHATLPYAHGGGVFLYNLSAGLEMHGNASIHDCTAYDGGAVEVQRIGATTTTLKMYDNTSMYNNDAERYGGAILAIDVSNGADRYHVNNVFIESSAVRFYDNESDSYYSHGPIPADVSIYNANIHTTHFSDYPPGTPQTLGYNNYDISYGPYDGSGIVPSPGGSFNGNMKQTGSNCCPPGQRLIWSSSTNLAPQ